MNENDQLIVVYSGSEASCLTIQAELLKSGVESMIKNDFQSGILGGYSDGVSSVSDLYVRQKDLAVAEPVLRSYMDMFSE